MNVSWHEAVPLVLVPASAQVPELAKEPEVGAELKLTVPVGVLAPLDTVSVTVAVHIEALPVATDDGEQLTLVDDGSSDVSEPWPLLVWWLLSPL